MSGNAATPLERDAQAALTDYQRIAARMYTLDANMGRRLLTDVGLAGRTADIADEVNDRIGRLWGRFDWLRRALEAIPSPGDEFDAAVVTKLRPLLGDAVVPLDERGDPVEMGDVATRITLGEFATRIESEAANLLAICQQVDEGSSALADTIAEIDARLDSVDSLRLAEELPHDPVLDRLRARRRTDVERSLADPLLSLEEDWLGALDGEIRAYADRLTTLEEVRDQYPAQSSELRVAIGALGATETAAAEACSMAAAKIAEPAAPRLSPIAATLSSQLTAVHDSAQAGDWTVVARQLADLRDRLTAAMAKANRADDQARALLDRRTELRGRFSAYTAKAARLGVIEEPATAALFEEAQRLLKTAPCDLPSATRAIHQFQQAIQASTKETRR